MLKEIEISEMIKCETCPYYIENNKGYPYCCLYCMDIDRVAIFRLCNFMGKEINGSSKDRDE